ncbi:hypothetical protein, variant 3 [Aphanomyces astaci]|uniref:Uncharacterized protein n=1 Tax=Aphanomyces astaci TaxID=112090 RepID=W4GLU1_APHAT|nr:hypothetical protein, variant 3 [Aphanomyces astaci]ETV80650.1 hypothetical protein, variant 3 [Aphanomyces astaci]|eukprot:XP_009829595.1 hypothetical protein, variant 3 [Aphanomyces astaci]
MHEDLKAHLAELKSRQKTLTARRIALEKKQNLRDSTMAEFSAAYADMLRRKLRACKQHQLESKKRNHRLVSDLLEYQKQHFGSSSSSSPMFVGRASAMALVKAKQSFADQVEVVYPAWQEQVQHTKLQRLRQLEQEKLEIEHRRVLAKQSFDKEQALEMLLQQAAQDISFAATIERNEVYQRQLFRQQKVKEAEDMDYIIQARADQERRRLEDEHLKALESSQLVDQYASLAQKYTPFQLEIPPPSALPAYSALSRQSSCPDDVNQPFRAFAYDTAPAVPVAALESPPHRPEPSDKASQDEPSPLLTPQFAYVPIPQTSQMPIVCPPQACQNRVAPSWELEQSVAHPMEAVPRRSITPPLCYDTPPPVSTPIPITSPRAQAAEVAAPIDSPHVTSVVAPPLPPSVAPNATTKMTAALCARPTQEVAPPPKIQPTQDIPPTTTGASRHNGEQTLSSVTSTKEEGDSRQGEDDTNDSILADYYHMTTDALDTRMAHDALTITQTPSMPPVVASPLPSGKDVEPSPRVKTWSAAPLEQAIPSTPQVTATSMSSVDGAAFVPTSMSESIEKPTMIETPMLPSPQFVHGEENEVLSIEVVEVVNTSLDGFGGTSPVEEKRPVPEDTAPPPPTLADPSIIGVAVTVIDDLSKQIFISGAEDSNESSSLLDTTRSLSTNVMAQEVDTMTLGMRLSIDESFEMSESMISAHSPHAPNVVGESATSADIMSPPQNSTGEPPLAAAVDILMLDGMSLSPEKPIPRMTSAFPSQPNNLNESTEGPTIDDDGEYDDGSYVTATFKLTVNERLTVLQTLILRIEETTKEGEQVSAAIEASIEVKAKLDLLKVAMGGRKAQIGFFGGDVCFALLVDICRDVAPCTINHQ